jgi:D-xylose transport system permease protein
MRDYVLRVRSGDVGALPVILGLFALFVFFSSTASVFHTRQNLANLPGQSAVYIFIAMGLVFVLLLGEIDLSAGFAAGASASILAVTMTKHGWPWPLAVLACIVTGTVIGLAIGLPVAKLGIPSFVVTLAFFLGLQGVMLLVIGEGGTIGIDKGVIRSLNNDNMRPWMGWVFTLLCVAGFALARIRKTVSRRRSGLTAESLVAVLVKVGLLTVVLAALTWWLNEERSRNPLVKSLKGIPVIVPFTVIVALLLTFILSRTAFGRHVYAIGGNPEAARRAGINVAGIRITCFMTCSGLAAFGGIVTASRDASVSPTTGGSGTLLLSVAAAVIGGTSLFGGKGRILDAVLGGLVVGTIQNGLPFITQRSGVQFIVTALVLLLAASVDALTRRGGLQR